jgi:hypothetical protein
VDSYLHSALVQSRDVTRIRQAVAEACQCNLVDFQANARMDRPRNRRPISRWLNTLRHSATVNQTWNY